MQLHVSLLLICTPQYLARYYYSPTYHGLSSPRGRGGRAEVGAGAGAEDEDEAGAGGGARAGDGAEVGAGAEAGAGAGAEAGAGGDCEMNIRQPRPIIIHLVIISQPKCYVWQGKIVMTL